jgi:hypothetical protein
LCRHCRPYYIAAVHTLSVPMARATSGAVPSVCVRHGEPAVLRLGFGKQVRNWPYCRKCRLRWWLLLAVVVLAVVTAFLTLVVAFAGSLLFVDDPATADRYLRAIFQAAILMVCAAGLLALLNTPSALARAKITPDRQWVVLQGVHPTFVAEMDKLVGGSRRS